METTGMGERKIEKETGAGERKRDRDAREKDRETGAGEGEIGRETEVGEREREREREREGRKRINYKHKKIHGILSCRATIHCRASIRLPIDCALFGKSTKIGTEVV